MNVSLNRKKDGGSFVNASSQEVLVGRGRFELPTPRLSASARRVSDDILEDFRRFCIIDKQLANLTASKHVSVVRRFLCFVKKDIKNVTVEDVREFLGTFLEKNPKTYSYVLCGLKVFLRDYSQMEPLVKSFRFPYIPFKPNHIPTKQQLETYYDSLEDHRSKTLFLFYASSGLRRNEVLELKLDDVDFEKRMIIPKKRSRTKLTWVTFFNGETEKALKEYLLIRNKHSDKLFPIQKLAHSRIWTETSKKTKIHLTPQKLREWFAQEMSNLGVQDRFIDAFCGRVPRSVLARHYTDYSPERLKEIYDKADLKVLG